jgi:predicted nucleic acid-binding protein
MIFPDIPAGSAVFLDANVFVYCFVPDPVLGPACRDLLVRVSRGEISGITSSDVLGDVAHRLMTYEAAGMYGWPMQGIAYRLQRHPAELQALTRFRQAVEAIPSFGVQVLPVAMAHVLAAAALSQQHGLLSGDALVVAVMHAHGLAHLASHDIDFDRVPALTRYAPL